MSDVLAALRSSHLKERAEKGRAFEVRCLDFMSDFFGVVRGRDDDPEYRLAPWSLSRGFPAVLSSLALPIKPAALFSRKHPAFSAYASFYSEYGRTACGMIFPAANYRVAQAYLFHNWEEVSPRTGTRMRFSAFIRDDAGGDDQVVFIDDFVSAMTEVRSNWWTP